MLADRSVTDMILMLTEHLQEHIEMIQKTIEDRQEA